MDATHAGLARRASFSYSGSRSDAAVAAIVRGASLSPRRSLLSVCALTFAMLTLFATAGAQRASACVSSAFGPLPLSTFEGADGDQCDSDGVGPRRDWQNVAGDPALSSTIDAPSTNDTIYGSNNAGLVGGSTDENVPDSWNFTNGNIGSGKFDALAAYSYTDPENNKLFVDLGFVRATTSGDTFLAFELNQRQPGYRQDPNEADPAHPFNVPTRTSGDLLVTYHVGTAGAQTLGLCVWDGTEHTGRWEEYTPDLSGAPITNQSCPALSSTLYQAAINDGASGRQGAIPGTENYLNPGTAISAGQFGEAVVNLTDALRNPANPNGPQPCVDFGYVWLHSRSSDSLTSSQQDFILPNKAVSIGNCTVEGTKFNDLNGDGIQEAGETGLAGWTIFVDYNHNGVLDNNMDSTFVNDFDGIVEPGEEEPYAITADGTGTEPLGSYRITKVQPSNDPSNPSGTWDIREILQPTWDCTAAVGGGAVLAPNVCPEDTSTNPDNALGFRLAWNDNQIYSGRDFGNKRQPAQLTVIKHVVNDDGGTAAAGAWSLHVTSGGTDVAGSPQPGDEAGDTYSLTHGQTYNVNETGGPSGYTATYSGDCASNGDVTVAAGQTKVCTITNDDVAPVLTVIKHVVNNNGGTAVAGDFTVTVDDPGTNPPSFPGAEAGTNVTVDPGAYGVTEGAHAGYTASYSAGCNSTLAIGETKTCTITNDDIAPVLNVVKHVVNDNGGTAVAGDFQITVDDPGTNPPSFPGSEAGTNVTVDPGAYGVTEGTHTGYTVSYSADCNSTLAIGETKVCTITNDDVAPVLTVVKHVINDDGGTGVAGDFTITVDDPGTNPAAFPGSEAGTNVTVDPGAYGVTEGAHAGYTVSYSTDCNATLAIGQTKTCTITNDDIAPVLNVVKHVVNNNGGTAVAGDFQITVDDPGTNPPSFPGAEAGTNVTVDPGAYGVTEGTHPGYTVTYSADCNATLAIGQTKTCTITNDDVAPGLTVVKHVINNDGGTAVAGDFQITIDDPGTNPPSFPGAEAGTNVTVDPGTYGVTEGTHTGYTVSYSADCNSTLAIGETKVCTITNDDIAPVLTVVKHVINNDGGTGVAGDFTITVDDPGTNPAAFPGAEAGTNVTVDPGAYGVTEGAHAGYTVSYSTDCNSTLAIGQTKTCTITNDDIAPVLHVVKHVINNNGGTGVAGDFTITVDDPGTNPPSFPGAEAGTNVTVDPGAYGVTEGTHTGYTVSYSADCNSTLAVGETKTCTITNDDIAPVLTVIKHVINNNGGTGVAGDFTITVDDPGTNPAAFPGSEAGTNVTVDPGAYGVTEGAHTGYTVSYSADCNSTLAIGDTKTCTITNDDIAPVLTVVKHVINNSGGAQTAADFQITVDDPGTNPPAFPGSEAGTNVTVDPGAYGVTEGAHTGYTVSYSADCNSTLAIGQTKTCTITNDDIAPVLHVVKHVVNNNGGTSVAGDFQITVDDPGTNPPSFPGAEAGTNVTVDPGAYGVTEGAHAGYAVTYSSDCNATLAIGETKTCTVTNDDIAATLTVIKHVVNDDGGTAIPHDFDITVDDPGTNPASFPGQDTPGTLVAVDPGAYSVSEGAHSGYAVSYSAGCTGSVVVGGTNTCTITNDDIAPTLTVIKTVVNKHGSTATASDFTMHIAGAAGSATFPGAATPGTTSTLHAGGYAVTETGSATSDYSETDSADCSGTLAVGDAKTCMITNTRKTGTINVVKQLIPAADTGRFNLRIDSTVVRSDAGDGDGSGPVEVNTGTHTVSEVSGSVGNVDDYVTSIACTPGGAAGAGAGPLDVVVTSGADITCTVTNTRKASVTIRKVTDPADAASPQFGFSSGLPAKPGAIAADGSFSLAGGQLVTTNVAPGTYPVSENDPRSLGYKLVGLTCVEDKTQNTTVATGAALSTDRNASIHADSGEIVFCTFTNRKILAQPVVVKAGDTFAYNNGIASYTFSVTNSGNSPLHDVHVSDDLCPSVSSSPTLTTNDNGDGLLDPIGADGTNPEVWVFTCSYQLGPFQAGQANSIVNTATVTAMDEFDRPVTDSDQHSTMVVHPAIAVAKTGPAGAVAGGLVPYTIVVTNSGNIAFVATQIVLSDGPCEAPPALVSVGGDTSPATLDPGDSWHYACSVQTAAGQAGVHNVVNVDATDLHGHHATGQAVADTALSQPTVGSSVPVAAARLRGPTGCMPPIARYIVTGTRIAKVTFTLDGRHTRVVKKADKQGRWVFTLRRKITLNGTHRVQAKVTFLDGSSLKTKTLRAAITKCRAAVAPVFTG
ncbi:MAG: hypothetical protein QOE36_328 [Gaiellaceae bacterium]|nr:hypothetical protein [Gaiellaceae bacterium]